MVNVMDSFLHIGNLKTDFEDIKISQSYKTGTVLFENISDKLIEILIDKSNKTGPLNNRSFMRGKRNHIGFMGEYLFSQMTRDISTYHGNIEWDFDFLAKGIKVDVKTKSQGVMCDPREGKPEPFDVSIPVYSEGRNCDRYSFFRCHSSMKMAWMIGKIDKKKYFEHPNGFIIDVGDIDGKNKLEVKEKSVNLKYNFTEKIPTISLERINELNSKENIFKGSVLSNQIISME